MIGTLDNDADSRKQHSKIRDPHPLTDLVANWAGGLW
jgi:hypothetical protein